MTLEGFWKLIDDVRQASGNLVEMPGRLTDALSLMDKQEIVDFDSHFTHVLFHSYDAKLWLGAVVMLNGCGDDTFVDFRCWLIAQGRDAYEAALSDPDSMADLERYEGDHGLPLLFYMGSVAVDAFCKRVAGDPKDPNALRGFKELRSVKKHPSLKNRELINKSDEEAEVMFPRLAAKFPKKKHTSCFDEYEVP